MKAARADPAGVFFMGVGGGTVAVGRQSGLAGYRWRKTGMGLFFAAYASVAILGDRYSPMFEYYPVFSWSLFSHSPAVHTIWELRIHRIGEQRFEPPVNFYDLPEHFSMARNHDSGLLKAANRLAQAVFAAPDEVPARRRMIERQVLDGVRDVDYELVAVSYRPLERWREGTVIDATSYARFVSGELE